MSNEVEIVSAVRKTLTEFAGALETAMDSMKIMNEKINDQQKQIDALKHPEPELSISDGCVDLQGYNHE